MDPPPKENFEEFQSFFNSIFKVNLLNTLEKLTLTIKYNGSIINLPNDLYSFNTISDLKHAIYDAFDKADEAAPNNQLIFFKRVGDTIEPIDFNWDLRKNILRPGTLLSEFVTGSGEKQPIVMTPYNNNLLENRIKNNSIHLLLLKDVLAMLGDLPQPFSEKIFNGSIYPYFPYLKQGQEYPNEKDKQFIETRLFYNEKRFLFINKIQELLEKGLPLVRQSFNGFRYLQLRWSEQDIRERINTFFFELNVNERRPYMRLLPASSVSISKVHLKDVENKIPNIFDIRYLKGWSDEQSPRPDEDFVLGKIALSSRIKNLPNIYSTIRLYSDGSFDIIVEPPKNVRILSPSEDFDNFTENLYDGIGSINRKKDLPIMNGGRFTFTIILDIDKKPLTRKEIKKRLPFFSPFFQEIPPLPNENPHILLRYKCVNNFVTEDNISNYLTQINNKKLLRGDTMINDMVDLVIEEFQIDKDTAIQKVSDWFRKKSQIQEVTNGESKEYIPFNNTGIDIAIFDKHPTYTFHYENIDSYKNLQMIHTLFSLMFSLDDEEFLISKREVRTLAQAEQDVEVEQEEQEEEQEEEDDYMGNERDYEFSVDGDNENEEELTPKEMLRKASEEVVEEVKEIHKDSHTIESEKDKGIANFFIRKLQEFDKNLFKYEVKSKLDKTYVLQCAANEMRQPALLTFEQYERMIKEYDREDDNVVFHEYYQGSTQKEIVNKSTDPNNIVTVLRYGSNPSKPNYFICSKYFCTRDEIMILEKDFRGTTLRHPITDDDGTVITKKPKDTCPFCMGKLIHDRKKPAEEETVLERIVKPNSIKRHLWIGFTKKSDHPDGFRLPCCFVKHQSIKFQSTKKGIKKVKDEYDDDNDSDEEGIGEADKKLIEYISSLGNIEKKYIVGEEKLPLEISNTEGPQIGLIPKALDPLFEQDSTTLVSRRGTPQKLNPNVKGFLRLAAENKSEYLAESFLSALAPYYIRNSSELMKSVLLSPMIPRVFIQMNYGNLVLEFYNPKDIIRNSDLKRMPYWANKYLGIEYNESINGLEVQRIYNSYKNFEDFMRTSTTVKEYRHFAMILAQSNLIPNLIQGTLISRAGTTIIVIDINKDNSVSIRCPPYGYNSELMDNNNIIFLMHHYTGVWEPLFYVDNTEIDGIRQNDLTTLVFQKGRYNGWPEIVKKLYGEFKRGCSGPGKTIYTSQSNINSNAMISLSMAKKYLEIISQKNINFLFTGILRDAYNHIVAIICKEKVDGISYEVALPVIDDGILITDKETILNWNDFNVSPVKETIRIYRTYLLPVIGSRYPGYNIIKYAVSKKTKLIVGVQLKNLLFIPVEETANNVTDQNQIIETDDFEWDINRKIILEKNTNYKDFESKMIKEEDLEEIYQHLRVSFGNYLSGENGSLIKEHIETDILSKKNKDMSIKEKRRRMMVLFGTEVLSWFSTQEADSTFSFIRNDCRVLGKELCKGHCVWSSSSEGEGEEEQCKIHIPESSESEINIGEMLTVRLMDEIIRYSVQRRELFNNKMEKLVFFKKPIQIGEQYILPENSIEWVDMLRVVWNQPYLEKPRFYEEMSSNKITKVEVAKDEVEVEEVSKLSNTLKSYLNPEDPKTNSFIYYELTKEPSVLPILNSIGVSAEDINVTEDTLLFTNKNLFELREFYKDKASFIQLNLTTSPITSEVSKVPKKKYNAYPVYVFIIDKQSSGLLVKDKTHLSIPFTDLPTVLENLFI
uniref:Uncharacterized protein n=1 Tax=viral metagenome TaxID=1070528 RepID=A0A6C0IF33_9ZZZZ